MRKAEPLSTELFDDEEEEEENENEEKEEDEEDGNNDDAADRLDVILLRVKDNYKLCLSNSVNTLEIYE